MTYYDLVCIITGLCILLSCVIIMLFIMVLKETRLTEEVYELREALQQCERERLAATLAIYKKTYKEDAAAAGMGWGIQNDR